MLSLRLGLLLSGLASVQDSAPAHPRRTVSGTIAPLPGGPKEPVRVWLWEHDYQTASARLLAEVTAGDGRFAFADIEWRRTHEWGSGFFLVVARQKDHAIGMRRLRGDDVDPGAAHVTLRRQVTLRGTARDETGKPVAGAAVRAFMLGNVHDGVWLAGPQPPWQAQTDAEGRYALPGVPADTPVTLFARHARFAEQRFEVRDPKASGDVELHPGATIAGRVFVHGKPAARVRVEAQGIRGSTFGRTLTDDDGRYRLESLEPDHYNVWALTNGLTCVAIAGLAVEGGETAEKKDLALIAGGFIEGVVVDETTNQPVQPGATADVGLYGPSRPRPGAAIEIGLVGKDGTFRIRAAPGSNYVYLRTGEGWHETTPGQTVDVQDGKTVRVEFKAARGGRDRR